MYHFCQPHKLGKLFPDNVVPDISADGHIVPIDIIERRIIRLLHKYYPKITNAEINQYFNEQLRMWFTGIPFKLNEIQGLAQETIILIYKAEKIAINLI